MSKNAQAIELWIKNLGKSHSSLVQSNIIPASPLKRLYEDSQSLEVEPFPGIELSFWFETQRFEAIHIYLISQAPESTPAYNGELPPPYNHLRTQGEVHNKLGVPFKSRGALTWDSPNSFKMGGWDFYMLETTIHPNCQVEFQYDENLHVYLISFSVLDREG